MLVVLSGLLAGALHVISGPDHLAAIGPLAAADPGRGARLGATWGVGHGGGVLILASFVALARTGLDLDAFSARAEALVGLTLVAMGLWSLRRMGKPSPRVSGHHHAAFGVGMLHGTAGAGHLLAALPALGLDIPQAFAYLAAYLAAAALTMSGVAWLLVAGLHRVGDQPLHRLRLLCSLAAVVVGIGWTAEALL